MLDIFKDIKFLISDVDGVLTDGSLTYDSTGVESKTFHVHDGLGIKQLMSSGVGFAIITKRSSKMVEKRMAELGVAQIYQGQQDKLTALARIQEANQLHLDQIAYIGDDLPDLPIMQQVMLPIAVANACAILKKQAKYITTLPGGQGAVREVCDLIVEARR